MRALERTIYRNRDWGCAEGIRGCLRSASGQRTGSSPGARPFDSHSATQRVALNRGAEAPGQRTAARRVQRRVGPTVQLPLAEECANRTIDSAPPLGGGSLREIRSAALLRAQSDLSLPRTRRTRERGAHECPALAPVASARPHLCESRQAKFGLHRNAQPAEGKGAVGRTSTRSPRMRKLRERSGQRFFAQPMRALTPR